MKGTTALITGATGGIGRELALEFARRGYDLVLTATREEPLLALAEELSDRYDVDIVCLPADLTRPEAPRRLLSAVRSRGIEVDVLVNNAGFGLGGARFHEKNPARQLDMIRVNVSALTSLCRLFLPDMVRRGYGGVINMGSLGSFVPGPFNAVYCATKAYVLSLSEALSEELQGTGVTVTAVCPGGTATHFAHRADMETTLLFHYGVLHPRKVARSAYYAFISGKRVEVVGLVNKLMVQASRILPRCLTARISALIQQPFRAEDTPCRATDFPGGR